VNTLTELLTEASEIPQSFRFAAQVQKCTARTTKSQKPYFEIQLVDALQSSALKVWNNHPMFAQAENLRAGTFLLVEGEFTKSQYGLESANWTWSPLSDSDRDTLLLGDASLKQKQDKDWSDIQQMISEIKDPRLLGLCSIFIEQFGDKFRRAAAARKNHHARRGGLIEHVSQMMRTAKAIGSVYQELNTDLITTAVLFHDCGKIWENNYPEEGFEQGYNLHAEALGHICLGIELINKLWRDLAQLPEYKLWQQASPPTEHVRVHLLHLIASHHGQLEFGSPVLPKTPEAFALHYIDNLDAKMEMCSQAYEQSAKLSSQIYERKFPLPTNLIAPLNSYDQT